MGNGIVRDYYRQMKVLSFDHNNFKTKESMIDKLKENNKPLDNKGKVTTKDKNKEDKSRIKTREAKLRPGSIYNGKGIQMDRISQTKTNYLKKITNQGNKMNYFIKTKEENKASTNKNTKQNYSINTLKSNDIRLRMLRTMF
ncbi:hypothetical protein [Clostridium frigidicarnis]|uniref:Uncharacterized protein n=1 Tax=Clostridium frigidicarnis TaxID=84698 RepID=A0A1I0W998_9CLOT|nr:hypothetical protein [Clostridium frigidicarnis]SFA84583.1 hypothetical protein SAMN04488528_1004110 [Clostridium frigidicarnis]